MLLLRLLGQAIWPMGAFFETWLIPFNTKSHVLAFIIADLIYVLWFKMPYCKTTKLGVTSRKTTQIPKATEKQFNRIKDFFVNDFFF